MKNFIKKMSIASAGFAMVATGGAFGLVQHHNNTKVSSSLNDESTYTATGGDATGLDGRWTGVGGLAFVPVLAR